MSTLAPTALRGQSRSASDRLAKRLGYFSIALGMAGLLAPRAICDALGMEDHETLVRAYGAREVATGVAILISHDATPWILGRVAGDAVDIATVAATALRADNPKQSNAVIAVGALVGITVLDAACVHGLITEKGGQKTAVADYSDRSGFPKPPDAMRGAAADFEVPADFRVPDSLRSDIFEDRSRRP